MEPRKMWEGMEAGLWRAEWGTPLSNYRQDQNEFSSCLRLYVAQHC